MFNTHETHLHERDYVERVRAYLKDHFGKTLDDLALSTHEIAKGLHDNLHPSEFIENNKVQWGIHRLPSSVIGRATRIVPV